MGFRGQRWCPIALPNPVDELRVPYANFIHACSDTLRRYCECLWYSGLEFKRPSNEEILANCGFLFSKNIIPEDLAFAFQYQLENLFAMSKVIHAMRSVMAWLDATETQAFDVMTLFEMLAQVNHFEDTIEQHWKALQICDFLLDHLGSIYYRVHPTGRYFKSFSTRAIVDIELNGIKIRANQWCAVYDNGDPNAWKIHGYRLTVPALLLEASTENGEKRMLKLLIERFGNFLLMCHAQTRRHLFTEITRILRGQTQLLIQTSLRGHSQPASPSYLNQDSLYVAKSRCPSKRWRSLTSNPQQAGPSGQAIPWPNAPGSSSPVPWIETRGESVRSHLIQLLRWLNEMPSPSPLVSIESRQSTTPVRQAQTPSLLGYQKSPEDVVSQFEGWWATVGRRNYDGHHKIRQIIKESKFLRNVNQIIQMRLDIPTECYFAEKDVANRPSLMANFLREQPQLTRTLIDELVRRLGEQFYHPKSGQFSYRWTDRAIHRVNSRATSSPSPVMHLFNSMPETDTYPV